MVSREIWEKHALMSFQQRTKLHEFEGQALETILLPLLKSNM